MNFPGDCEENRPDEQKRHREGENRARKRIVGRFVDFTNSLSGRDGHAGLDQRHERKEFCSFVLRGHFRENRSDGDGADGENGAQRRAQVHLPRGAAQRKSQKGVGHKTGNGGREAEQAIVYFEFVAEYSQDGNADEQLDVSVVDVPMAELGDFPVKRSKGVQVGQTAVS